jgi:hypothetical protein
MDERVRALVGSLELFRSNCFGKKIAQSFGVSCLSGRLTHSKNVKFVVAQGISAVPSR